MKESGQNIAQKVSLNNLQKYFAVAKVSSFSYKAIHIWDMCISLSEIGIPFEVDKGIIAFDLVTKQNLYNLQGEDCQRRSIMLSMGSSFLQLRI